MPYYYLPNGEKRHIKLILNLLAFINRTITAPMFEKSLNFIGERTRQQLEAATSLKEKECILFDMLKVYNEEQYKREKATYKSLSKIKKEEYMDDVINDRVYFHQKPMWEDEPLFFRLMNLYNTFNYLEPYQLYINKWGRDIPILNKQYIGDMYIMKLKQSSKKGFSVRSTGSIDSKELPSRSYKVKEHQELYSNKSIRFGVFETLNFSIGILPEDIACFHALYRSSPKAREIMTKHIMDEDDYTLPSTFDNRAVEIFDVIFKSLGCGIEFVDEDSIIESTDNQEIKEHFYNDKAYLCTDREFRDIKKRFDIVKSVKEEYGLITNDELEIKIKEALKKEGLE